MERLPTSKLSKEEAEGLTAGDDEICGDENFNRSLVGKIWTDIPFNIRAFKSTMIQAWRLKNQVEIQDLNKNLFLFRFASKKDADGVFNGGPWNFDRNLVILAKISGDEQPSDIDLFKMAFWVRVYDLPFKLRTEAFAKRIGGLIGECLEADSKEYNRLGKFLRIKVNIDLRHPLKRGTTVKF